MVKNLYAISCHFYPRPPRGGRPDMPPAPPVPRCISIHALREEGDLQRFLFRGSHDVFLSTPSARRATAAQCLRFGPLQISIHALREEGDYIGMFTAALSGQFLSTPSARRATGNGGIFHALHNISIHALREEGDSKNGEKHLRFCFIIKRSAQIWKSLSKNIRKKSRDLHRMP